MTFRLLMVLLTALAPVACASLNAGAYAAPGANLTRVRSYAWAPVGQHATGDARLDANRFFDEAVRRSIDRQLARRGLELRTAETPDALVRYHASVTQQTLARGRSDETDRPGGIDVLDVGSLVVDVTNPTDGTLMWRGWVAGAIDGVVEDQAVMERRIDEAVIRVLRPLPRERPIR